MTRYLVLHVAPVAKERARVTRLGAYTPPATKRFEAAVRTILRTFTLAKPASEAPMKLKVRFVLQKPKRPKHKTEPVTRPDLDNYVKALTDACNGVLWADDSQLVHIEARKLYDQSGAGPRIEMTVEELSCSSPG